MDYQCEITGRHNIEVLRGLNNNSTLLAVALGSQNIILYPRNDGSGRMTWDVEASNDGFYYLVVKKGVQPATCYLSWDANSNGVYLSGGKVDLQQKWIIEPVPNSPTCCTFHIKPAGKSNYFLSTNGNGGVDQWNTDDGSGRQRWQFQGDWVTT